MDRFDEKIKKAVTKTDDIPPLIRQSLDSTYAKIKHNKELKKKKINLRIIYYSSAVVTICVLFLVTYATPAGTAMRNFLHFGQFTSEKLLRSDFVASQDTEDTDKGITVRLNEIYFDQNEIGISLSAEVPENSELLTLESNEDVYIKYAIKFAIVDKQQNILFDFNSGSAPKNSKSAIESYTMENRLDKSNRVIDFAIQGTMQDDGLDLQKKMQGAKLVVTTISAIKMANEPRSETAKQLNLTGNDVTEETGHWKLPIQNMPQQTLPTLEFKAKDKNLKSEIFAEATPTTLKLYLKMGEAAKIKMNSAGITLSSDQEAKQSFDQKKGDMIKLNGQKYYVATFMYPEYDTHRSVFIHIEDQVYELVRK